jgi:hypothetical protein
MTMQGSPKQIKWAESIKEQYLNHNPIHELIEKHKQGLVNGTVAKKSRNGLIRANPTISYDAIDFTKKMIGDLEAMKDYLTTLEDSQFWIEHRHCFISADTFERTYMTYFRSSSNRMYDTETLHNPFFYLLGHFQLTEAA